MPDSAPKQCMSGLNSKVEGALRALCSHLEESSEIPLRFWTIEEIARCLVDEITGGVPPVELRNKNRLQNAVLRGILKWLDEGLILELPEGPGLLQFSPRAFPDEPASKPVLEYADSKDFWIGEEPFDLGRRHADKDVLYELARTPPGEGYRPLLGQGPLADPREDRKARIRGSIRRLRENLKRHRIEIVNCKHSRKGNAWRLDPPARKRQ